MTKESDIVSSFNTRWIWLGQYKQNLIIEMINPAPGKCGILFGLEQYIKNWTFVR